MIGQIGKYKMFAPLFATDFSDIVVCKDPDLDVHVTVKVFNVKGERGADKDAADEWRQRFLHEAKVMARMDHPNLVPIREYAILDDGTPYIVMPYYPATLKYEIGHDSMDPERLKKLPPNRRPHALQPDRALTIWRQLLEGLSALHGFGLVHRDVKPGNVFLTAKQGGNAKLGDFGMVKVPGLEDGDPGRWIGTPNYMSPEQKADATSVDPRTDIYSVGVFAYRMLIGRLPQDGPATLAAAKLPIPPELDSLIEACRAPHPDDRPENAAAVLKILDAMAPLN